MKTLSFVYTIPNFYSALYQPVMDKAFSDRPDLNVRFSMDNGILLDTLANDVVPTPSVKARLFRLLENAVQAGADCVVVGCTAVNTATKELSSLFQVPVISVDEPMIQQVLADRRRRVAVLSHTPINAATIRRRLLAEDPGLTVDLFPVAGAAEDFNQGRIPEFQAKMRAGALAIPQGYDAIVLGHISAENADFSGIDTPVYRTGSACVAYIEAQLKDK